VKEVSDDNQCFVCGKDNDRGLQLDFFYDENKKEVHSKIIFPKYYQGWENIVHGGLISTVLDEIQVKAAEFSNYGCVTGELNVKFKSPVKTGKEYFLRGSILEIRNKIIYTEGFIKDKNSKLMASATAKLFVLFQKPNTG